jgi:predicted DNA-binding transcriptional regulator AlpA
MGKESSPSSPWYRAADLARLFDVDQRQVWKMASNGQIPPPVKRGRKWSRWPKQQIDEIIRDIGADPRQGAVA